VGRELFKCLQNVTDSSFLMMLDSDYCLYTVTWSTSSAETCYVRGKALIQQ